MEEMRLIWQLSSGNALEKFCKESMAAFSNALKASIKVFYFKPKYTG